MLNMDAGVIELLLLSPNAESPVSGEFFTFFILYIFLRFIKEVWLL